MQLVFLCDFNFFSQIFQDWWTDTWHPNISTLLGAVSCNYVQT